MKKIAVINDLSGFGKCSLSAALPIISAHKIQCCPLPTAVFSNQTGYESYDSVDLTEKLYSFSNEWKKLNPKFDAIIVGFIPNSKQGKIISSILDRFRDENTLVAVDTVMGDDGEIYDTYNDKTIEAVKILASKADLITPNVTELALLCGMNIKKSYSLSEIEQMSKSLGNNYVITTGIELGNGEIGNAVLSGNEFRVITTKKHGFHFSGTGDIFVSYTISEFINGGSIFNAVKKASDFIEKAIRITLENEEKKHYHADGIEFETLLNIE